MNRLPARVVTVERAGSIALVEVAVDGRHYTATLLDADAAFEPGAPVSLAFKETEVALAKDLAGQISMRNRMPGVIEAIEPGALMSRVLLRVGEHAVTSVITTRSLQAMALQVGNHVEGLVKSNEMYLLQESA